ncbi:hypothetical protein C8A05DRAFT_29500 [Staphylotrichum tortipilum]|uniref:Uncharacterized protein n=1 Tax=Staphylotrichum tortipilum TaxID=2831512 RepID=A0AAN6MU49_9PEZI|nr:hypothetical protein C8A05DRAFT_29500 [Staphylotrichum longicolle]
MTQEDILRHCVTAVRLGNSIIPIDSTSLPSNTRPQPMAASNSIALRHNPISYRSLRDIQRLHSLDVSRPRLDDRPALLPVPPTLPLNHEAQHEDVMGTGASTSAKEPPRRRRSYRFAMPNNPIRGTSLHVWDSRVPARRNAQTQTEGPNDHESLGDRFVRNLRGIHHEALEIREVPRGNTSTTTLVIIENGPYGIVPLIEPAIENDDEDTPILGDNLPPSGAPTPPASQWSSQTTLVAGIASPPLREAEQDARSRVKETGTAAHPHHREQTTPSASRSNLLRPAQVFPKPPANGGVRHERTNSRNAQTQTQPTGSPPPSRPAPAVPSSASTPLRRPSTLHRRPQTDPYDHTTPTAGLPAPRRTSVRRTPSIPDTLPLHIAIDTSSPPPRLETLVRQLRVGGSDDDEGEEEGSDDDDADGEEAEQDNDDERRRSVREESVREGRLGQGSTGEGSGDVDDDDGEESEYDDEEEYHTPL